MTGCSEQGIDIVGIREHRLITNKDLHQEWSDDGQWLFAYASATHQRCGGVGILLSEESSKQLRAVEKVSDRIIVAYLEGNPALSILVAYAPTEGADLEDKSEFYGNLQDAVENIWTHNCTLLIGDFNARIGQDSHTT